MAAVALESVSVRGRTPGDDAFILRLAAAAFGDFDPSAAAHTRALVDEPGTVVLVATREDERLGFVVVQLRRQTAWVQAIAVLGRERGRGVGRRLMRAAESVARRGGSSRMRLVTAQANVEALELFLKSGFRIAERLPQFYSAGQDACVLTRAL